MSHPEAVLDIHKFDEAKPSAILIDCCFDYPYGGSPPVRPETRADRERDLLLRHGSVVLRDAVPPVAFEATGSVAVRDGIAAMTVETLHELLGDYRRSAKVRQFAKELITGEWPKSVQKFYRS